MTPRTGGDDAVLARLAANREADGQAFLAPHHLAAAERLERLILRSQVAQRVTMSYDPTRVGGSRGVSNGVETASDSAAAARQMLNRLAAMLPADCWGVLFDVCGFGKGLQVIELERRWPRRSAKLVLRIGLDQLAAAFGLSPAAAGNDRGQSRNWLENRLPLIVRDEGEAS